VLAGIRRVHGVKPEQKAPITLAELRRMVAACGQDIAGARDRALLLAGFLGAFRRSELVALELPDLAFVAEGLRVTVRRGKTDQEGRGVEKALPVASDVGLCAVKHLRAWLVVADISEGRVFRSVNRHGQVGEGLSDRAVAGIVKRRAEQAGLEPARFSGHSLRAGFATAAALAGRGLDAIMRQTGHRSVAVARGYVRAAEAFDPKINAAVGLV